MTKMEHPKAAAVQTNFVNDFKLQTLLTVDYKKNSTLEASL